MSEGEDAKPKYLMHPISPQGLAPEKSLPYVCLGSSCPNTCCGPFHGTGVGLAAMRSQDLGQLSDDEDAGGSESVFAQIRLLPEDVERLQDAGLDSLIVRRGTFEKPRYFMRLLPDGTCSALAADGLCSIHHARPTLCRAFPFYVDLFAGLSMLRSCPGVGAGNTKVKDLETEIGSASKLTVFWLKEISERREP